MAPLYASGLNIQFHKDENYAIIYLEFAVLISQWFFVCRWSLKQVSLYAKEVM